jgi:hypothetical protein
VTFRGDVSAAAAARAMATMNNLNVVTLNGVVYVCEYGSQSTPLPLMQGMGGLGMPMAPQP